MSGEFALVFIAGLVAGVVIMGVCYMPISITTNKLIEKACIDQFGPGDYEISIGGTSGKIYCRIEEKENLTFFDETDIIIVKEVIE